MDTTATSRNSIGTPELYSPDSPSSPQSPNRTSSTPETNVIAFESRTERLLNMHKRLEVEVLPSLNLQAVYPCFTELCSPSKGYYKRYCWFLRNV